MNAEACGRVFALSEGNPLYLRHRLEGAERQSNLSLEDGWQLTGNASLTRQVAALIDLRLSALGLSVPEHQASEEPLT